MMRTAYSFFALLTLCFLAPLAHAADEAKLKAGDAAPSLSISKWVKGEPVEAFAKGKVYIVEFWATWCGPCKVSIPHVTKLQEKYKDKGLVVIGVSIWERDTSLVEPFVKEMGGKMEYTVAMDKLTAGPDGQPGRGDMAMNWMSAAGRNGIPSSFIVDREGKIAWVGHPMQMDRPLAKVIEGTFDAKAQAEMEVKLNDLQKQAFEAVNAKDYDKALALRDAIVALDPDQATSQKVAKMSLYFQKGDSAAANALASELVEHATKEKDSMVAAQTASMMLAYGKEKSDADVALKAAQLAYDLSDKTVAYQRLLAQGFAGKKQYDKAIELQTKVVESMKGPLKTREEKALAEYKEAAGK